MSRFRSVLALALLAVMASGAVVPELHRAAHAAEAAEAATAHVEAHHAGHDHEAPGVEAPCVPELAGPDCAVCAVAPRAVLTERAAIAHAVEHVRAVASDQRAAHRDDTSAEARGPPQT